LRVLLSFFAGKARRCGASRMARNIVSRAPSASRLTIIPQGTVQFSKENNAECENPVAKDTLVAKPSPLSFSPSRHGLKPACYILAGMTQSTHTKPA